MVGMPGLRSRAASQVVHAAAEFSTGCSVRRNIPIALKMPSGYLHVRVAGANVLARTVLLLPIVAGAEVAPRQVAVTLFPCFVVRLMFTASDVDHTPSTSGTNGQFPVT
jgi:hypothetical protein